MGGFSVRRITHKVKDGFDELLYTSFGINGKK